MRKKKTQQPRQEPAPEPKPEGYEVPAPIPAGLEAIKLPSNHADTELRQIAMDLHDRHIFTDRHIENPEMLKSVFMPIALGGFQGWTAAQLDEIGMVYEYMDKAGPRSINGMPMFMSMKVLNVEEYNKMIGYFEEYKKLKEEWQQNPPPPDDK